MRTSVARRLAPSLAARGLLRSVDPDLHFRPLASPLELEPLFYSQWWYQLVGADRAVPPAPGRPVTVIDTGVDLAHPEFRGRPDTIALNTITFNDDDRGSHGTAVGSLVAAPVNGVGLVGIYPRARLQVWDGYDLSFGAVIAGLAAASKAGPGVINLSLGYPAGSFGGNLLDPIVDAVNAAIRRGSVGASRLRATGARMGARSCSRRAFPRRADRGRDRCGLSRQLLLARVPDGRPRGPGRSRAGGGPADDRPLGLPHRLRYQLLCSHRRRRGGLGVDGATRARRESGARGHAPLGPRPR